MIAEVWTPIRESKGYEVSNTGKVRNIATGEVLKPRPIKTGYERVHLPLEKGRKDFYIHRLVAEAYCDHPAGCDVVNHLDNDIHNNSADNLEWTTQFGNVHHGMKQRRYRLNAVPVVGYKDGNKYEFASSHQAAIHTGCGHSTISKCCKGKQKTTHGYSWRYAEVV